MMNNFKVVVPVTVYCTVGMDINSDIINIDEPTLDNLDYEVTELIKSEISYLDPEDILDCAYSTIYEKIDINTIEIDNPIEWNYNLEELQKELID